MDDVDIFLQQVITSTKTHSQWLNTLSYLEYRGARKILRALDTSEMDEDILTHTLEEVRHALYFKKLATKIGGKDFRRYEAKSLLSETAIKKYFYELDNNVHAAFGTRCSVLEIYRIVTWLIEKRALMIYRKYAVVLQNQSFKISLRSILIDETGHLQEMQAHLREKVKLQPEHFSSLIRLEETLFAQTLVALMNSATGPQSNGLEL